MSDHRSAETDGALTRVREYLAALDGFYGDEVIPDVLDTSDGGHRSPALRLSDVRTLAALATTTAPVERVEERVPVNGYVVGLDLTTGDIDVRQATTDDLRLPAEKSVQ